LGTNEPIEEVDKGALKTYVQIHALARAWLIREDEAAYSQ
jgi:hypothetical protein